MDILKMMYQAMEENEFIPFLRGEGKYIIETSQYAPEAEVTDVGKVLSRGIYKGYRERIEVKEVYEDSLFVMLSNSDFDVYMVCLYLMSQLFKEKNELSPFYINKDRILEKCRIEIGKRNEQIKKGIVYPNGYVNTSAWDELVRFNEVCKVEYGVTIY